MTSLAGVTVPDAFGTVRAYRSWDVCAGGRLRSLTREWYWEPGLNHADCPSISKVNRLRAEIAGALPGAALQPVRHDVPVRECTCGLYATRDPGSPVISNYGRKCFGVVEMHGGVVLHEDNHVVRAEHAAIVAVCLPWMPFSRKLIAEVKTRYPQARVYSTRAALLADYPPDPGISTPQAAATRHVWQSLWEHTAHIGVLLSVYLTVKGLVTSDWWLAGYGGVLLAVNTWGVARQGGWLGHGIRRVRAWVSGWRKQDTP